MPRVDLNSTALRTAAYQDQRALLELEFRSGAVYHYFGVPAQTYQDLLRAPSQGGYFNSYIRNRFACTKIHPAGPAAVRDSDSHGTTAN